VRALVLQVWALLTRDRSGYLTDRYSERRESAEKEAQRLAAEAMRHEVKAAD
jgi:arsenic resistance protein ArsH